MPFWVKTVLLGQEVHYYMVYIAYFTELNLQICDYVQKQRIHRKNSKYALDENFHGHFFLWRKAANFCHPVSVSHFWFSTTLTLIKRITFCPTLIWWEFLSCVQSDCCRMTKWANAKFASSPIAAGSTVAQLLGNIENQKMASRPIKK